MVITLGFGGQKAVQMVTFARRGSSTKGGGGFDTKQKSSAHLGGGFKYFLFSPLLGEMIQFD